MKPEIIKIKSKYEALEKQKDDILEFEKNSLISLNNLLNDIRCKIKSYGSNNDKVSNLLSGLVIENDEIFIIIGL